jgi:hypothetical protein
VSDLETGGLEPIQKEFLEHLASKPDEITDVLSACSISPRRLATWLGNPTFRAAYMVRCSHYEEMQFPGFVAGLRKRAMGDGKDAYRYAKMYLDFFVSRGAGELPQGEDPISQSPDPDGSDELKSVLEGYGNLGKDDIADLL